MTELFDTEDSSIDFECTDCGYTKSVNKPGQIGDSMVKRCRDCGEQKMFKRVQHE